MEPVSIGDEEVAEKIRTTQPCSVFLHTIYERLRYPVALDFTYFECGGCHDYMRRSREFRDLHLQIEPSFGQKLSYLIQDAFVTSPQPFNPFWVRSQCPAFLPGLSKNILYNPEKLILRWVNKQEKPLVLSTKTLLSELPLLPSVVRRGATEDCFPLFLNDVTYNGYISFEDIKLISDWKVVWAKPRIFPTAVITVKPGDVEKALTAGLLTKQEGVHVAVGMIALTRCSTPTPKFKVVESVDAESFPMKGELFGRPYEIKFIPDIFRRRLHKPSFDPSMFRAGKPSSIREK
jgi:hypothetical protein